MIRHLLAAVALLAAACGGKLGSPSDSGPSDAAEAATGLPEFDAAFESGVPPGCRDDRPLPGTPYVENGRLPCMLPDGGLGVGMGGYGCVDPNACKCKPGAGPSACNKGTCIYASCSGTTEGDSCAMRDGTVGLCCAGTCRPADYLTNDPKNCGGCGVACAEGAQCIDAYFEDDLSDSGSGCDGGVVCAQDLVCAPLLCAFNFTSNVFACDYCVAASCAGKPDGTVCAQGICCQGQCIDPGHDSANCGGCGITCCPGTQCDPSSPSVCLAPQ